MAKIINDEKGWQAECDADTMARYEEIMADTQRRNAAIKAAKARATDLNKRANAMARVASTRSAKPAPKKKK